MLKIALAELWRHSSYGDWGKSIKPFCMIFFVSVFMSLGRRHLLHPIGRPKETKTEGSYTICRQMKWKKNGLWMLRSKRWLTCLNEHLLPSTVLVRNIEYVCNILNMIDYVLLPASNLMFEIIPTSYHTWYYFEHHLTCYLTLPVSCALLASNLMFKILPTSSYHTW